MDNSYIAMYRRWRPRTFDEVRGQDAVVTALKNQIKSGRIGHAYLFCGTRGTGKTSVAKILARAVNCEHPQDGNPCNECASCSAVLADAGMNVIEIDAASNNGVDNIRDIRDQVQYPPTEGRYKVFIIDEVHMLSAGAFNALLKTLEEPPEYVIFILATTEVNRIPVTVVSRCQRYDFRRIPASVIAGRLRELTNAENISIDDRALDYIARMADGALRDAISLLDECVSFSDGSRITYDAVLDTLGSANTEVHSTLFAAMAAEKTADMLRTVDEIVMRGRDLSWYVSDYVSYLRNLLIIKTTDDPSGLIDASDENMRLMKRDASAVSTATLMRYIKGFSELSNRMRLSDQKRVLLELTAMRLMTPVMDEDPDAMLDRISRLERRLEELEAAIQTASTAQAPFMGQNASASQAPFVPQAAAPDISGAAEAAETVHTSEAHGVPGMERHDDGSFERIRDEWDRLVRSLGGIDKAMLKGTVLEKDPGGGPVIVWQDGGTYGLDRRSGLVEELNRTASEMLGMNIRFKTALRDGRAGRAGNRITREELSKLINMPIESED